MTGRDMVIDSIDSKVELNNGVEMPYLGLGVYLLSPGYEANEALTYALEVGYRLIDTASFYGNEYDIGKVVRESSIPREQIIVTTKLWNSDHGYDNAIKAYNESLITLGLDYIDLYLIHWPVEGLRYDSWRALEKLYEEGKCRAIGVSNYTIKHLQELIDQSKTIPAVNQVEFSPFLYQEELLKFCKEHGIQLEAYSPLTRGNKFSNKIVMRLARKHQKTPAQILLRWALEHGVVVIPKSANKKRIWENANIFKFSLDEKDMQLLNNLNENYRVSWDPTYIT